MAAVNMCANTDTGHRVCSLTKLVSTDGRPLAQGGDSGGPVHIYNFFGNPHMSGTVVAISGTSAYYHPFNTIMPSGWTLDMV